MFSLVLKRLWLMQLDTLPLKKNLNFGGYKECDLLYFLGFPSGLESLPLLLVLEVPETKEGSKI